MDQWLDRMYNTGMRVLCDDAASLIEVMADRLPVGQHDDLFLGARRIQAVCDVFVPRRIHGTGNQLLHVQLPRKRLSSATPVNSTVTNRSYPVHRGRGS